MWGKKVKSGKIDARSRVRGAVLETLERRDCLSVSLADGELEVRGTSSADAIIVRVNKDGSALIVNVNGEKTAYSQEAVDSIKVLGGRDTDLINVEDAVGYEVTVYGGPGKDEVIGAVDRVGVHGTVVLSTSGLLADSQTADASHFATGTIPAGEPVPSIPGRTTGSELRTPPAPLTPPPLPAPIPPDSGGGTDTGGTGGDQSDGGQTGGTGETPPDPDPTPSAPPFVVWDSTYFNGKPDLSQVGMPRIWTSANEVFKGLWPNYDTTKPDEAATRALAREAANRNQPLCIDIEHWPIDIRGNTLSDVQHSIGMLTQIVDWVHNERPQVKIGFYGMMPLGDYWSPVLYANAVERSPTSAWWTAALPQYEAKFKAWQAANDLFSALAAKVDFFAPSLYTFYDDPQNWVRFAKYTILEAKRFNKPVYGYLWMEFHDSSPLKGHLIPSDYWTLQLETVKQYSDGVVIWGGYQEQWNPQAPWYLATQQFIEDLQ